MPKALVEYELVASDGDPLAAADVDFFLTSHNLTTGSDQTPTLTNSISKYARSVTVDLTDGDSSITSLKVWLTGKDVFGQVIQETLDFGASPGTSQQESLQTFRELTSLVYHADGTSSPDPITVGFGDILGLPRAITAVTDLLKARVDDTEYEDPTSGAGTFTPTPGGGSGSTWEPLGGVIPDGARRFYVQVAEDV